MLEIIKSNSQKVKEKLQKKKVFFSPYSKGTQRIQVIVLFNISYQALLFRNSVDKIVVTWLYPLFQDI